MFTPIAGGWSLWTVFPLENQVERLLESHQHSRPTNQQAVRVQRLLVSHRPCLRLARPMSHRGIRVSIRPRANLQASRVLNLVAVPALFRVHCHRQTPPVSLRRILLGIRAAVRLALPRVALQDNLPANRPGSRRVGLQVNPLLNHLQNLLVSPQALQAVSQQISRQEFLQITPQAYLAANLQVVRPESQL